MHVDEAHYMRRAMLVLHGLGPQEPVTGGYPYPFDHPYFGQLFLAGALKLIDYPNSLNPSAVGANLEHSIEALYLAPRVVMGLLAVLDTFLIYKISQLRYNRNTALFASVLFAIMPLTWMLRRIYLDTILTPFLLSSTLFALYCSTTRFSNDSRKKTLLFLFSGAFLGIAIFTKIPAISIIPLVGFLVYKNSNGNLKVLELWILPVILIPSIWICYSVYIGHFDLWLKDSMFQAHRSKVVFGSMLAIFQIDPILLILSTAGVILAAIKRDPFILLWIGSFTIFFILIGWVQYFHWIPVLPIFCIAAARLIEFLSNEIVKSQVLELGAIKNIAKTKLHSILPYIMISAIGIFGLVSTTLLISMNVNSSFFEIYAAIVQHMPSSTNNMVDNSTRVTMIGSHWWIWNSLWIPSYIFHKNVDLIDSHFDPNFKKPIESKKLLFIVDQNFIHQTLRRNPFILTASNEGFHIERLDSLYKNTTSSLMVDNLGPYDSTKFPYTSIPIMILLENRGLGPIDIRAN